MNPLRVRVGVSEAADSARQKGKVMAMLADGSVGAGAVFCTDGQVFGVSCGPTWRTFLFF